MRAQTANAHWVVWMSLLMAVILSIVPLPLWLSLGRPAWVPMVVVFWALALPNRFGLFFAFTIGLILDLFFNSLFGLSSIGLLLITFVVLSLHRRLRMFPLWQQTFVVFLLMSNYLFVTMWIRSMVGLSTPSLWYLLPAVSSALVWPWLSAMLRFLQRYCGVM